MGFDEVERERERESNEEKLPRRCTRRQISGKEYKRSCLNVCIYGGLYKSVLGIFLLDVSCSSYLGQNCNDVSTVQIVL